MCRSASCGTFADNKEKLKVKKAVSLLMLCAMFICTCGCDPYVGKRPYDYGDSIWICEEPKITYVVEIKYNDELETDIPETYAKTCIDGEELLFDLDFLGSTSHAWEFKDYISKESIGIEYFHGTCKYSKTKFTIKVDKETDKLFDGKYDELVFVRKEDEKAD